MAPDPAQIEVLEQALAESPDNVTLRLHVARLNLDVGGAERAAAALAHAQLVLAVQPDQLDALTVAAAAASAAGQPAIADAYARMAGALRAHRPVERVERVEPDRPSVSGAVPVGEQAPAPLPAGIAWSPDGSHDDLPDSDSDTTELFISITAGDDGEGYDLLETEIPKVRLDDVGGLDDVKAKLRSSFLAPMQNPELRKMYGTSLRGGMLLYGPPGCGKTFLARAIAGELGAHFASVGLHEILDMWLGNSEKNVHATFEQARRKAPCVLFLDEIDALGRKRSQLANSAGRNVTVQLLNELDGMQSDNEGVFVIGATNQPWDLDPALRRPGRFDRMLLVLPPDRPARRAILDLHLRDRPVDAKVDRDALARRTEKFSGADLRHLCESAAQTALQEALDTGTARPISARDFDRARDGMLPSTLSWFEVARNFAQFANEGGRYDELLDHMRTHKLG